MRVLRQARSGQPIELTQQIADSGEGTVWRTSLQGMLAKLYHQPTAERIQKLKVMVATPPQDPMAKAHHITFAWPQEILQDQQGRSLGFLMPEITNSVKLSSIYNPKLRSRKSPRFNWHYLHTTALNFALGLQSLHQEGYVVGDIKPQNLLVNNQALISIIDTDSFQVRAPNTNRIYRCLVGSEGFTPPELLGKDLAQVEQTDVHDRFRLAVIVYLLLFGDQPFKGRWIGPGESPQPTTLIQKGYWPFGVKSLIKPGPTTISLDIVHPHLQACFRRCFDLGHQQPSARPTAGDWVRALQLARATLTVCQTESNHTYSRHYGHCCWCERSSALQLDIFDPRPHLKVRTAKKSNAQAPTTPLRPMAARMTQSARHRHLPHRQPAQSAKPWGTASSFVQLNQSPSRFLLPIPKTLMGVTLCAMAVLGLIILIVPESLVAVPNDVDRKLERQLDKTMRWLSTTFLGAPVANEADGLSPLSASPASASLVGLGHDEMITALLVSPDQRFVLSGSRDFKVKVWDIQTGQLRSTLSGHYDPITALHIAEQGRVLISHDERGKVVFWDLETSTPLPANYMLGQRTSAGSLATLTQRRGLVFASNVRGGIIQVRDLRQHQRPVQEIDSGPFEWHQAIAVTPDAQTLISSGDGQINLWDLQTGKVRRSFPQLQDFVAVEQMKAANVWAMSPDGRQLASGGWDGSIHLWQIQTGQLLATLSGHQQAITTLVFSPDGQRLISGGNDHLIKVWDVALQTPLLTLTGHQDQVSALSVSGDQRWLVSGSKDKSVKVWRLRTGELVHSLGGSF